MHVPRSHRAFIDLSFLAILDVPFSFETGAVLKVVIKYFYPTSTLSSGHFKTVGSPQPSITGVRSRKAQSASD